MDIGEGLAKGIVTLLWTVGIGSALLGGLIVFILTLIF